MEVDDDGVLTPIEDLVPGDLFRLNASSWNKRVFIGKTLSSVGRVRYIYCSYWNGEPGNYAGGMCLPRHRIRHIGKVDVNIRLLKEKYRLRSGEKFVEMKKKAPEVDKAQDAESANIMDMLPGMV